VESRRFGISPELNQKFHDIEAAPGGGVVKNGSVESRSGHDAVDVDAELDHQTDSIMPPCIDGTMQHVHATLVSESLQNPRVLGEPRADFLTAALNARERERFERIEIDPRGAMLQQVLGDRMVTSSERLFIGRAAAARAASIHVGAAFNQQRYAIKKVVHRRPTQLLHQQRVDSRLVIAQSRQPRTASVASQTIGKEQLQMIVVVLEVTTPVRADTTSRRWRHASLKDSSGR
jgi:hypothetical protein